MDTGFKVVKGHTVKTKKTEMEKRLSQEEVELLLASITPETHKSFWKRNRAIILFLLHTGLRVAEICGLRIHDVLTMGGKVKGVVDLRAEIAKRKKPRHIPLNDTAQQCVKDLIEGRDNVAYTDPFLGKKDGKPLTKRAVQDIVTNACLKAGINRLIGPHTLRHSCLSRLYEKTGNIKIVQVLAGHSNASLTINLYTHVTMDGLTEAMKVLDDDEAS